MKNTVKTEVVLLLFRLINTAKYNKMADADKIKLWKIQRALKPIADKFDDDIKSSSEKLRPEGFDDRLQEAKKLEDEAVKDFGDIDTPQQEKKFVKMLTDSSESYAAFQKEQAEFIKLCNEALQEFADAEVELEFEPIGEDAFGKLMASNDWTLKQAGFIAEHICE